jgi:hypothetical protein
MKPRTLISLTCIAALCVVGMSATAGATASRSGGSTSSNTRLTIKSYPRLYGYVKSPHPARCANGRRVKVFRKHGHGHGKRVATVHTHRVEGVWQWATKGDEGVHQGRFYARTAHRSGCPGALSRTIRMNNPPSDVQPSCPGDKAACDIGQIHFDSPSCENYYKRDSGDCEGSTLDNTIDPFRTCWKSANFHWNPGPGDHRDVALFIDQCGYPKKTQAYITGYTTRQAGGAFTVTDAHMNAAPGVHWCTPNPPITTLRPGDEGGPLYLDFQNATLGADVIFTGYLIRKGSGRCG